VNVCVGKMNRILLLLSILVSCAICSSYDPVHNSTLWDNVVRKYVSPGTEVHDIAINSVDYMGISQDPDFAAYLQSLEVATIDSLDRNETYAFFINVYNALAVNMIITHACGDDIFGKCGPIKGIQDIGTLVPLNPVWGQPAGTVGGKVWSLDDVENYLRAPPNGMKEDPRLHACIVCASVSCPNIRNSAYTVHGLNEQMTDNFNDFLNNTKKGMKVDRADNKIYLSSIFNWFASDFQAAEGSVLDFILVYLPLDHPDYQWISNNKGTVELEYFDYDWDINSSGELPCDHTRVCYPVWALLVTLACLLFVVCILVIVIIIRNKWKKRGYHKVGEGVN